MKKHLRYLLTLLLVMVASVGWAEEEVFYTLSSEQQGSNNSYASNCDIEIGGITWNVTGNAKITPWRIGGKSITNTDRAVYSKTAMTDATTKVVLEVGAASSITVNSLKLIVASDANFSNQIDEVTATFSANSKITFTPTSGTEWATGAYYKFVFNVTVSVSSNKFVEFKSASFYKESGSATAATTSVTIDNTGITNTDLFAGTAAGQLTATVKDDTDTAIEGATVTWTSSKEGVATVAADGTVTLVAEGTTTITAAYAGVENVYRSSSATYELTVIDSDPNKPGSLNNPYTVAQALENTPATGTTANVYVKGIVSGFYSSTITGDGSNYRYYISDDGTETSQMLVYKGNGLNNVPFTNANDLLVGDTVVVYGGLTTYNNSTKEIAANNYIVSLGRNTTKVATPTFSVEEGTYTEAQSVTITTTTVGAKIYYTIDGTDPTTESNVYSEAVSIAETTTLKAIAVKEGMTDSEIATAEYTIVDTGNWVFDELTYDLIGVSGTSYTTWSGKSTNSSSAVYAGNSAGGNESIQLRSTSNSGIVTTKSGGKAKQVVVIWNSNTASGRTLDVYGKNTAYSTAADLYSYDNKGDKLGSIAYGETTLTIEGDYEYIGVRSYSGAMYLDAVKIAWEPDTTAISVNIGETGYATLYYSDVNLTVPEGVTAKTYKANGTALVELDSYNTGDVIPAGTGVVLNGAQGDYTFAITTESGTASKENMLRGSDEAAETTGGAKYYMLSLAATGGNETVGFYYKAENGAAFMNGAHKAYLAVPEGTEAKAAGYAFNEMTGINDITREQVTDGVWYTIDGKRLNGEPTVKGIYVVNGKKVVIK